MTPPSPVPTQTRQATVLYAVLMGMVMTFIVTCVVTAVNTGIEGGFFLRWMRAFVMAWPVASTCILIFAQRVRRLVDRMTAAGTA